MTDPILDVNKIAASYGPSPALFDVSLKIHTGEALALLGRNGMGKSTTVKVICRLLRAKAGTIRFNGHSTAGLTADQVARRGIGLVPEGRRCFAKLTVQENLEVIARPGPWTRRTVADLFPRLAERRTQLAGSLSGGEQQMLAIGRALMTNPQLLILDEATEGLAPVVRQEIWSVIKHLKMQGLSLLIIDKSIKELHTIADRAVVLDRGASVWAGNMADLNTSMQEEYLGV